MGQSYSVAIDMWSLGCILVELFSGEPLFCGQTEHDQMCRICDILGLPPPNIIESGSTQKIAKMFVKITEGEYRLIPAKNFRPSNKPVSAILRAHLERTLRNSNQQSSSSNSNAMASQAPDNLSATAPSTVIVNNKNELGPGNGTWSDHQRFAELIERMLAYDPQERITPEEALHHPFFKTTSEMAINTNHTMGTPSSAAMDTSYSPTKTSQHQQSIPLGGGNSGVDGEGNNHRGGMAGTVVIGGAGAGGSRGGGNRSSLHGGSISASSYQPGGLVGATK
jgi:dual specificity tyrosine-phosphorylation-regulated kinase 1